MISTRVLALLAGKSVPLARGESSAIAKTQIEGRVRIGFLGIQGDEQADLRFHGGPDKAIHHYPFDHYGRWARLAADQRLLGAPGAFGENVSTCGMNEDEVCIGDRFRLGSALVEISQGRQPCWKQGVRLQWKSLPALMVKERHSGWYYRVIEEGDAEAGDDLSLLARPHPDWTVKRVFGLLIAGDHRKAPADLPAVTRLESLAPEWRQRAAELAAVRL